MKRSLRTASIAATFAAIVQLTSCATAPSTSNTSETKPSTTPAATALSEAAVKVVKRDLAFDKLVPTNAKFEKVTDGHQCTEGPLWNKKEKYVLFSDIPNNAII